MVGAVFMGNSYMNYYQYRSSMRVKAQSAAETKKAVSTPVAEANGAVGVAVVSRPANLGVPVEPVDPVRLVQNESSNGLGQMLPFLRQGADPVEMAVRMRIQPYDGEG